MTPLRKYLPYHTVEGYSKWKGDWELCDGVPVSMSPSPFGRHGELMGSLITQLKNEIDERECDSRVLAEIDWIISEITIVRPNISVVCGTSPQRYIQSPPALAAEILSPSTRSQDQPFKRGLCREEGVPNYLIADPDANELTLLNESQTDQVSGSVMSDVFETQICDDCRIQIGPQKLFR